MKKPADFARALLEVGGLGFQSIGPLRKRSTTERPPHYVPVLQHGIDSEMPLDWAAIPLRSVMRTVRGVYGPLAASPNEIRARFGLHKETRLIFLGTGQDAPIETYWRWRRFHDAPAALAKLGLDCAIAPNYSVFLNEPRTQHLFNRKRSLVCAAEISTAGVPAVPYLHAIASADWTFWERFLREHPEVDFVAKEFQTGLAHPERGEQAIVAIARLQDRIGRDLHLLAIGASRYRAKLASYFGRWTILDSVPFMKAVKRRCAFAGGRRIKWEAALGDDVGDLVFNNARRYAEWVGAHAEHHDGRG